MTIRFDLVEKTRGWEEETGTVTIDAESIEICNDKFHVTFSSDEQANKAYEKINPPYGQSTYVGVVELRYKKMTLRPFENCKLRAKTPGFYETL